MLRFVAKSSLGVAAVAGTTLGIGNVFTSAQSAAAAPQMPPGNYEMPEGTTYPDNRFAPLAHYPETGRYKHQLCLDENAKIDRIPGPAHRPGEPTYSKAQVAKYVDPEGAGMWVTYRDGVYDVTSFVDVHPGGANFIKQAAGGPVDNLWAYWHWHHASAQVPKYLEQFRIGRLSDWKEEEAVDMYEDEPPRPLSQRTLHDRPWSSQTAFSTLNASYLTPADSVYVRSHCPVPALDKESHSVTFCVGCADSDPVAEVTLQEMQKTHGTVRVTSVIQCGGNRAAENLHVNGPSGFSGNNFINIDGGMMSNVMWSGIRLATVLRAVYPKQVLEEMEGGGKGGNCKHVEFYGNDGYYASVPLRHCLEKENDVLLATGMNGADMPSDHGHPLRVTLPGVVGARNVKWLEKIVVRDDEGDSPWNNYYYKNKSLPIDPTTNKLQSAQQMPLNCVILKTQVSTELGGKDGRDQLVEVSGIAFPGGSGQAIESVDVSTDQGATWQKATLRADEVIPDDASKHWHWMRWYATAHVDLASSKTNAQVWARAKIANGDTYPDPDALYTICELSEKRGGYLYNGYHKVCYMPCRSCRRNY